MAFHTGDTPTAALIPAQNMLKALGRDPSWLLFCGCLDAPDYLPAGSHKSVILEGDGYAVGASVSRKTS